MLKKTIKWGILGTSPISTVMAKAMQESQTSELFAIGSRSLDTAKKFSEPFSIPKLYADFDHLLNDSDIDAIYIGLPNHLHKEWMIRAAEAGKHILCEKPFVISVAEAHAVIAAVKKANVFCMEALMYRHHPVIKKLQELLVSKVIGEIKLYSATYTANIAALANPIAGGSIRNLGCYPVSLVRLLANAEPVEIIGQGRPSQINTTDNQASVILKFPDESLAVISTADDIDMFWQFDIYGTEGHLQVISNPWLPTCNNNKIIIYRDKNTAPREIIVTAEKSLYTYQIDVMNQCIMSGEPESPISLLDSLNNTYVLETWRQQALKTRFGISNSILEKTHEI